MGHRLEYQQTHYRPCRAASRSCDHQGLVGASQCLRYSVYIYLDLIVIFHSVKAFITGGTGQYYTETLPAHKKNPDIGTKITTFGPVIYLEQEDARSFEDNEEVSLRFLL